MSLRSDPNLLLETNFQEGFFFVAVAVVSMVFGLVLAVWGYRIGWLIGLLPGALVFLFLLRRSSQHSRLLLTPGGFTFESGYHTYSYRWSEVEQFRVCGAVFHRTVEFSLTPAVRSPSGIFVIPEHYGIGTIGLCNLLNEWRVKYSERVHRSARRA